MNLACCICLYVREGQAEDADTIINGLAVCMDHASYVSGGDFSQALRFAKKDEAQASKVTE